MIEKKYNYVITVPILGKITCENLDLAFQTIKQLMPTNKKITLTAIDV